MCLYAYINFDIVALLYACTDALLDRDMSICECARDAAVKLGKGTWVEVFSV